LSPCLWFVLNGRPPFETRLGTMNLVLERRQLVAVHLVHVEWKTSILNHALGA
jgi:hypothetical protein